MSTRAVITVMDNQSATADTFHVYQHGNGYPTWVLPSFHKVLPLAWELPRFEAMDFAAAIVAGLKTRGGGIYLTKHHDEHGDLEWRYEVSGPSNGTDNVIVRVFVAGRDEWRQVFYGRLKDAVILRQEIEVTGRAGKALTAKAVTALLVGKRSGHGRSLADVLSAAHADATSPSPAAIQALAPLPAESPTLIEAIDALTGAAAAMTALAALVQASEGLKAATAPKAKRARKS